MHIEKKDIEKGLALNEWDFGNHILYRLCNENFEHKQIDKIIAKVWLIGRSYAAAIERRKNKTDINDNFYINAVAPAFKNSKLDNILNALKKEKRITIDNIADILEAHNYLLQIIEQITNMKKRSFCSKYLHFHLPDLFFIYDSRAVSALRLFISRIPANYQNLTKKNKVDTEYAKFFIKSFLLTDYIEKQYNIQLNPRAFDKILIVKANNK